MSEIIEIKDGITWLSHIHGIIRKPELAAYRSIIREMTGILVESKVLLNQ